jgi:hypothetical protein
MLHMFQEHISHVFKHSKLSTCTSMVQIHDTITGTHNIHVAILQGHVSSKDAHEMTMLMVMSCHDHAQMMLKCKANTRGVTVMYLNVNVTFELDKKLYL